MYSIIQKYFRGSTRRIRIKNRTEPRGRLQKSQTKDFCASRCSVLRRPVAGPEVWRLPAWRLSKGHVYMHLSDGVHGLRGCFASWTPRSAPDLSLWWLCQYRTRAVWFVLLFSLPCLQIAACGLLRLTSTSAPTIS